MKLPLWKNQHWYPKQDPHNAKSQRAQVDGFPSSWACDSTWATILPFVNLGQ